jgi:uncharacterized damage-inducible protein DinB
MTGAVPAIVSSLRHTSQRTRGQLLEGTVRDVGQHFLRMFVYDHWANRECLAAIGKTNGSPEILRRMAHILSAEKLWLERLRGEPQSMAVWPSATPQEVVVLADEMRTQWQTYLHDLPAAGFDENTEYRNSKGEKWSSRVEDVLTHVLMHSAYHRGQIALEMRTAGAEPAYTDFIHAVRRGFVE